MKKDINRCMGCMSEKLYSGPCEICGYSDNSTNPPDCLAPGTYLSDRYVLGKLISKGGEGAVYLAFDTKLGQPVEIGEFMPDTLCVRGEDHESVVVMDGALPLFKSYLSEYADLHKSMMTGLDVGGLKKTFDIFAANGTGYVVTEHTDGITLEEYLSAHGGKLSWAEASPILIPLFDTLSALHEKGIVHRGLSPETIIITKENRAILTSVEISAARTADSRLSSDLYSGYAACEQYDLSERQGSWTDVYGMSATLYRVLTGIIPPEASSRKTGDTLEPADTAEPSVPKYVSDAITAGMKPGRSERVHDTATMKAMLLDVPEEQPAPSRTATEDDGPITPAVHVKFDIEEHEEQRVRAAKKKRKKKEERRNIGTAAGLIIFLALVAALVICIIYFSDEARNIQESTQTATTTETEEAPPEITTERTSVTTEAPVTEETESVGEKLMMPDFVKRFFNSSLKSRYSMLEFEVEEEYSDEYSEGIIMEQDIPEGTQVTAGTTVHIKVSKGAAYTFLPDYVGMKFSDYTNKLTTLGVRYEAVAEETSEVKSGYVVRCSKNVGDKVYISQNESVTVYYAVKPVETTTTTAETEEEIPIDEEDDDNDEEEIV